MITLSFNIRNPFSNRWECLANPTYTLSEHKAIELQFDKTSDIIGFCFRLNFRTNHAGVFVSFALLGYEGILHFYDTRHWDHNKGSWAASIK